MRAQTASLLCSTSSDANLIYLNKSRTLWEARKTKAVTRQTHFVYTIICIYKYIYCARLMALGGRTRARHSGHIARENETITHFLLLCARARRASWRTANRVCRMARAVSRLLFRRAAQHKAPSDHVTCCKGCLYTPHTHTHTAYNRPFAMDTSRQFNTLCARALQPIGMKKKHQHIRQRRERATLSNIECPRVVLHYIYI